MSFAFSANGLARREDSNVTSAPLIGAIDQLLSAAGLTVFFSMMFNPAADNNWSIAPIKGADVTFESSLLAKPFAEKAKDIDFVRESENSGYGVYKLNFEGLSFFSPAVKSAGSF